MAKRILNVYGTATTPALGKVLVHDEADLARRTDAADQVGLTYEVREV
jgi:hypothetical protein